MCQSAKALVLSRYIGNIVEEGMISFEVLGERLDRLVFAALTAVRIALGTIPICPKCGSGVYPGYWNMDMTAPAQDGEDHRTLCTGCMSILAVNGKSVSVHRLNAHAPIRDMAS